MSLIRPTLSALALTCAALAAPALAASSAASSASESIASASSGSVSDSIRGSSNSSSGTKNQVAQGQYQVVAMTAGERAGTVVLQLQGLGEQAQRSFELVLPQLAAAEGQLAAGSVVSARERGYGWEFASEATQQAFFLVVADAIYQDLQTRVVKI